MSHVIDQNLGWQRLNSAPARSSATRHSRSSCCFEVPMICCSVCCFFLNCNNIAVNTGGRGLCASTYSRVLLEDPYSCERMAVTRCERMWRRPGVIFRSEDQHELATFPTIQNREISTDPPSHRIGAARHKAGQTTIPIATLQLYLLN